MIRAATIQFQVTMDLRANTDAVLAAIRALAPDTLAVAPEGALSGYAPTPDVVESVSPEAVTAAQSEVRAAVREAGVHLVIGACLFADGEWRNASLYFGPQGETHRYDKINLAVSERGVFTPGDRLPVFDITVAGAPVRLGIQMCREIRYPEQWRILASKGAQVFAYVNNAIGAARGPHLWRSHLISRAAETQRFIIGANNAAVDQTCPSMIISPEGEPLTELDLGVAQVGQASLDLAMVSDWVLDQARVDVVAVTAREPSGPNGAREGRVGSRRSR